MNEPYIEKSINELIDIRDNLKKSAILNMTNALIDIYQIESNGIIMPEVRTQIDGIAKGILECVSATLKMRI